MIVWCTIACIKTLINIHKLTDTTAVLLATVGLAQARPIKSLAIKLLHFCWKASSTHDKSPLVLAIWVKMSHVARLFFGKQIVW